MSVVWCQPNREQPKQSLNFLRSSNQTYIRTSLTASQFPCFPLTFSTLLPKNLLRHMDSITLNAKAIADLRRALKDFKSDKKRTELYGGASNRVFGGLTEYFSETRGDRAVEPLPPPDMVFLALVTILGFKYLGKGEKVFWTIPIFYKTIPFQLHHRKFGLTVRRKVLALLPPRNWLGRCWLR